MNNVIKLFNKELESLELNFSKKPILIGGRAMEYYGIRKADAYIDLVICDEDYQLFSHAMPTANFHRLVVAHARHT